MRIHLKQSVEIILKGGVLAIPTETVYGLAASLSSENGIKKIFQLKNRPLENPLIVHISQIDETEPLVEKKPPFFEELASRFWPGPLTLVVPASDTVPTIVRAHLPSVALRIPGNPLTRKLIRQAGPLVAPSANLSGRPSSTCPEHVEEDFGSDFPILDGGACAFGLESTILIFRNGEWTLGRLGAITCEQIAGVLGYLPKASSSQKALCPGQKFRHYSPKARLKFGGERRECDIVLGFDGRDYPGASHVISLGSLKHPEVITQNLYKSLREVDLKGFEEVWVDSDFPRSGLLEAVAERLKKASN